MSAPNVIGLCRTDPDIDKIIEAYGLDFYSATALSCLLHHGRKTDGDPVANLRKAIENIERRIERIEGATAVMQSVVGR